VALRRELNLPVGRLCVITPSVPPRSVELNKATLPHINAVLLFQLLMAFVTSLLLGNE
jgi:hypothetical protein